MSHDRQTAPSTSLGVSPLRQDSPLPSSSRLSSERLASRNSTLTRMSLPRATFPNALETNTNEDRNIARLRSSRRIVSAITEFSILI